MTLPSRRPAARPARVAQVPVGADAAPFDALSGLDDRALVARMTEGDGAALETLFGRYGGSCYGFARRILGDEQLAQDVVQEVFLTLWRDGHRYDPTRGGFSTWLLSMTHHKSVDSVRKEERLRSRRTTVDVLDHEPDRGPTVEDAAWGLLRRDRVREALKTLPEPQREALALAYFGGYTQREIAGLTDTPLGTVKTRMLAGMRRLRLALETAVDGNANEAHS
ncbi:MAG TPA: sigma-70 family RNA polymerase sigma factor [Mycobacteriales bacterium]|nr:sigma-70 family RNA polymerase sigma factor [Mycobacteriales bacterium]